MIPPTGLLRSSALVGEPPTFRYLAAAAIILGSVVVIPHGVLWRRGATPGAPARPRS